MNIATSWTQNAFTAVTLLLATTLAAADRPTAPHSNLVYPAPDGHLTYQPAGPQGDTIPDFSNAGYQGGGVPLPSVPAKLTLSPSASNTDDTARLQQAIDQLASLPLNPDGFRGALLLKNGTYHISGQLKVAASGIILRGEGDSDNGTTLVATGKTQRDLVRFAGKSGPQEQHHRTQITDPYVPVGSRTFTVADASPFKPGDQVIVRRVGNAAWIHFIKMDQIQGRPGHEDSTKQWQPFDLPFDRVITHIDGNRITVDAPIVCAIDQKWGGGTVAKYDDTGRIQQVGLENLRADSEFDPSVKAKDHNQEYLSDENHAMYLASFDNVKNAWERNCTTTHFYHGPADVGRNAKWVTIQDCKSLDPVSVLTGGRRYPYKFSGQLNLVQRCYARDARHAFVVDSHVCGPNVFLDCVAERNHATSEPHHRWSVGGLYDNVHADMAFQDRQWMGSGHGWAGANYVAWNCEGSLVCQQPPTAQNYAIGFVGKKEPGAFTRPDGYWESLGTHVQPRSLYLQQLRDRLGKDAVTNISATHPTAPAP